MQICIDVTSLLLRSAGVKNYTYHWWQSLARESVGTLDISAFPMMNRAGALNHEHSVLSLAETLPRIALLHCAGIPGFMNLAMRRFDVFHSSNLVRYPPTNVALTATLYDMTCLLMPEKHTAANVLAERNFAERVLRRAQGIIAISENTKRDAVRTLGLDANRIAVIYPGVPQAFFDPQNPSAIRERYALKKPYVLIVGTVEPRKNLDTLLDAWAQMAAGVRESFDLVIAGPMGWASESTKARLREVRYLGYIPEADLPPLTAGATVFAYPSLYEGFGFPLAQAMAAGVASVTSHVSSLPEVAGDSALLVDPRSVAELRDALLRLLTNGGLRAELGQRARKRAEEFTWENAARKSVEFFQNLR